MTATRSLLQDLGAIGSYLNFGYLPAINEAAPFAVLESAPVPYAVEQQAAEYDDLLERAADVIRSAVKELVERWPSRQHVVLLSGGYDSRGILGALLECVDRKDIVAVTYGYPANEESVIARQAAAAAGVEHKFISVPETRWSTDELLKSVATRPFPPSFVFGNRFQNHLVYEEFGSDCTYWEGFLAGVVTGGRLQDAHAAKSWEMASAGFAKTNSVNRGRLAPPGFDAMAQLPGKPLCPSDVMAFDDQLDLAVRQTCYIANRIPSGFRTATPFTLEQNWRFWLSLPRYWKDGQLLYRAALVHAFPSLFALPIAGGRGRIKAPSWLKKADALRRSADLKVNWLMGRKSARFTNPHRKIGEEMRCNDSLRRTMAENISDLADRRLIDWLDPLKLWSEHLSSQTDNTQELRVLGSLEIALKSLASTGRRDVPPPT